MMLDFSYVYLCLTGLFYFGAVVFHFVSFFDLWGAKHEQGFLLIRLGFITGTLFLALEALAFGLSFPMQDMSHVLAFFAWSLAVTYLFFFSKIQSHSFGLILSPGLFALTVVSIFLFGEESFEFIVSPFFALHIVAAYFAYASITISFAGALFYLIQHIQLKKRNIGAFYHKLPSLEELKKLTFYPMLCGVLLLLLAIAIGLFWSYAEYGEWWLQSSKTLATLVTLSGYLVLVCLSRFSKIKDSRLAALNILFFCSMVLVFILRKSVL